MKFLKAILPLLFAPVWGFAIVGETADWGSKTAEKGAFSIQKGSKAAFFQPKLAARRTAFFRQNEPSDDEKKADQRAVRAFAFGILGIGFLFMLPTWIAMLSVPFLLLAFFNGTASAKKTYRRGMAITGIICGSVLWAMLLLMMFVLIADY